MPRIPTGEFGFRVADPARQSTVIPDVRVPVSAGIGQGIQQLGRGLEEFAQSEQRIQEFELRRERTAVLQDNLGKATGELQGLEETFARDQDFRTSPARFEQEAGKLSERYAEGIQDDTVKAAFLGQFRKLQLQKSINIRKSALDKEKDYNRASLDENLDVYANAAANAKTPEEQGFIAEQAAISITAMQRGGWISQQEAGDKDRKFRSKIDTVSVLRDIANDPELTADKLATDPKYVPNLDEVQRQRYVDTSLRQAESMRSRLAREEEKRQKQRSDELLSDAYKDLADGKLTRKRADEMRHLVSPAEYRGLLDALKKQATGEGGGTREDNKRAFAEVQVALYESPQEAAKLALSYHKQGLIKDSTLAEVYGKARTFERQEGPRSQYERSRQFVLNSLDPGQLSADPAPKARMGVAVKELDDWVAETRRATGKEPSDKDIETRAQSLIDRYSIVNMNDLVRKTGVGSRSQPQVTLDQIAAEVKKAQEDRKSGKLTQQSFNRKMKELDELRERAEGANRGR